MEVQPNQTVDISSIHQESQPSKQPKASPYPVDTASVTQRFLSHGSFEPSVWLPRKFDENSFCFGSLYERNLIIGLNRIRNLVSFSFHALSQQPKRLQKELMSLMMGGGDLGVSAFPEGESIFSWVGTIEGGNGTMYEGLSYKLSLRFPLDYPFKPPLVKFETMCFHPNVDQFGNICLDILQDKWSSAYDVRTILLSIQSLLGEANTESPLNNLAASLWNNQEEYRKMVHKQYFSGEVFGS